MLLPNRSYNSTVYNHFEHFYSDKFYIDISETNPFHWINFHPFFFDQLIDQGDKDEEWIW